MDRTTNLGHEALSCATARPDAIAIASNSGELTYRELQAAVSQRIRHWGADAPGVGDVAVLTDPMGPDLIANYIAALTLGCVVIPNPPGPHAAPDAILHQAAPNYSLSGAALSRTGTAPDWTRHLPRDCDPSVILFTSGTTGVPKAILHTHQSLLWGVWNTASVADEIRTGVVVPPKSAEELPRDFQNRRRNGSLSLRFSSVMPLNTIAGLSVLNRSLILGDTYLCLPDVGARGLAECLAKFNATNLGLTPFIAQQLLRSLGSRVAVPSLLTIGIGGGRVPPDIVYGLESALGCLVTIGYGSTELGGVAVMTRPTDPLEVRAHTIGSPLSAVQVRFAQGRNDHEGRLYVSTPSAAYGILRTGSLHAYDGVWRDTGDLASTTGATIRISGRADYVIVRGGRLVDPVRLELLLESHPLVKRAAVGSRPSRIAGEQDIVAFVVAREAVSEHDLRRHCAASDTGAVLQGVVLVDELPTTADGAVKRAEIQAWLAQSRQSN